MTEYTQILAIGLLFPHFLPGFAIGTRTEMCCDMLLYCFLCCFSFSLFPGTSLELSSLSLVCAHCVCAMCEKGGHMRVVSVIVYRDRSMNQLFRSSKPSRFHKMLALHQRVMVREHIVMTFCHSRLPVSSERGGLRVEAVWRNSEGVGRV